jgi:hypothetical protein
MYSLKKDFFSGNVTILVTYDTSPFVYFFCKDDRLSGKIKTSFLRLISLAAIPDTLEFAL